MALTVPALPTELFSMILDINTKQIKQHKKEHYDKTLGVLFKVEVEDTDQLWDTIKPVTVPWSGRSTKFSWNKRIFLCETSQVPSIKSFTMPFSRGNGMEIELMPIRGDYVPMLSDKDIEKREQYDGHQDWPTTNRTVLKPLLKQMPEYWMRVLKRQGVFTDKKKRERLANQLAEHNRQEKEESEEEESEEEESEEYEFEFQGLKYKAFGDDVVDEDFNYMGEFNPFEETIEFADDAALRRHKNRRVQLLGITYN